MTEINFLCVHKKIRSKRLAPVLIKEITRRVHVKDMWQAVYTAGVVIPTPISQTRYHHRSLNPKKLIEVLMICILNFRWVFPPLGRSKLFQGNRSYTNYLTSPGFKVLEKIDNHIFRFAPHEEEGCFLSVQTTK